MTYALIFKGICVVHTRLISEISLQTESSYCRCHGNKSSELLRDSGLMKSVVVHFALLLNGFSDHGSFHFKEIFKGKVLLRGVSFFSVGNTNYFIAAGKYEHDVA